MTLRTVAFLISWFIAFGRAVACSPTPAPLDQLQTMCRNDFSMRDAFKPHKQVLDQQLFERERIAVRDISGEEAFKRIDGSLGASELSLILTGDLPSLRKHPKLTEINNPGTFGSGFSAYFAPDGTLVLFWIIPEG